MCHLPQGRARSATMPGASAATPGAGPTRASPDIGSITTIGPSWMPTTRRRLSRTTTSRSPRGPRRSPNWRISTTTTRAAIPRSPTHRPPTTVVTLRFRMPMRRHRSWRSWSSTTRADGSTTSWVRWAPRRTRTSRCSSSTRRATSTRRRGSPGSFPVPSCVAWSPTSATDRRSTRSSNWSVAHRSSACAMTTWRSTPMRCTNWSPRRSGRMRASSVPSSWTGMIPTCCSASGSPSTGPAVGLPTPNTTNSTRASTMRCVTCSPCRAVAR